MAWTSLNRRRWRPVPRNLPSAKKIVSLTCISALFLVIGFVSHFAKVYKEKHGTDAISEAASEERESFQRRLDDLYAGIVRSVSDVETSQAARKGLARLSTEWNAVEKDNLTYIKTIFVAPELSRDLARIISSLKSSLKFSNGTAVGLATTVDNAPVAKNRSESKTSSPTGDSGSSKVLTDAKPNKGQPKSSSVVKRVDQTELLSSKENGTSTANKTRSMAPSRSPTGDSGSSKVLTDAKPNKGQPKSSSVVERVNQTEVNSSGVNGTTSTANNTRSLAPSRSPTPDRGSSKVFPDVDKDPPKSTGVLERVEQTEMTSSVRNETLLTANDARSLSPARPQADASTTMSGEITQPVRGSGTYSNTTAVASIYLRANGSENRTEPQGSVMPKSKDKLNASSESENPAPSPGVTTTPTTAVSPVNIRETNETVRPGEEESEPGTMKDANRDKNATEAAAATTVDGPNSTSTEKDRGFTDADSPVSGRSGIGGSSHPPSPDTRETVEASSNNRTSREEYNATESFNSTSKAASDSPVDGTGQNSNLGTVRMVSTGENRTRDEVNITRSTADKTGEESNATERSDSTSKAASYIHVDGTGQKSTLGTARMVSTDENRTRDEVNITRSTADKTGEESNATESFDSTSKAASVIPVDGTGQNSTLGTARMVSTDENRTRDEVNITRSTPENTQVDYKDEMDVTQPTPETDYKVENGTSDQENATQGDSTDSDSADENSENVAANRSDMNANARTDNSNGTVESDIAPPPQPMAYSSRRLPPRVRGGSRNVLVTTLIAPVGEKFNACVDGTKCTVDSFASSVYLVPRFALSLLSARVRELKTRLTHSPVCESHVLARGSSFPVEGMSVANANVFTVKDVTSGSCLFLFYGGREIVDRFEMLPPPRFVNETGETYRHDMFTAAVYLPFPTGIRRDGTTAFLPVATRHSRMLFVVNTAAAAAATDDDHGGNVLGSAQMWFRDKNDLRAEFGRLQHLLSTRVFVHPDATVALSFAMEMPAAEFRGDPVTTVENAWKQVLHETGTYSRIPVEMFVDRGAGFLFNADFDSITVYGYLMDGMSYARMVNGELFVRSVPVEEICDGECGVRVQYMAKA